MRYIKWRCIENALAAQVISHIHIFSGVVSLPVFRLSVILYSNRSTDLGQELRDSMKHCARCVYL